MSVLCSLDFIKSLIQTEYVSKIDDWNNECLNMSRNSDTLIHLGLSSTDNKTSISNDLKSHVVIGYLTIAFVCWSLG